MISAIVFLLLSVFIIKKIENYNGKIGIRFNNNVLINEQIQEIYRDNEEEYMDNILRMTMWGRAEGGELSKKDEDFAITVNSIELWGDAEEIYPDCLLDGVYLSNVDESGCMLSDKAAFSLFGNVDIIGKAVLFDDSLYYVRGIIKSDEELIITENKNGKFSYMELEIPPAGSMEPVRQLFSFAGVSMENAVVLQWDVLFFVISLLQAVSISLLIYMIADSIIKMYGFGSIARFAVKITVLLIFFAFVIKSCNLPIDFVPTKWSDFEFFEQIIKNWKDCCTHYLDMGDIYKDRWLFGEFRLAFFSIFISILCNCPKFDI